MKCRYAAFTPSQILSHFQYLHQGEKIICGVGGCQAVRASIKSFRNHLLEFHGTFYPKIKEAFDLSFSSVFRSTNASLLAPLNLNEPDNQPDHFDQHIDQQIINLAPEVNVEDINREYMKILIENGLKFDIPFEALRSISRKSLDFFEKLQHDNAFTPETIHEMKYTVSSQDNFDKSLIKNFDAIFPETVYINGIEKNKKNNFVFFPFKKSLLNAIKNFSNFREIIGKEVSDSIDSFFSAPECSIENDTIYVAIYVDDFQLANPFLSKKSQRNAVTGIYYTILSKNHKNSSKSKNTHILGLCYESIFKNHSDSIFKYLAENEINPLIKNSFTATIGDSSRSLKVKIGFFCTDSKESSFLLGLKYGFTHKDCCRFCLTQRTEFNRIFFEPEVLKTHNWYEKIKVNLTDLGDDNHILGLQKLSPVRFFHGQNYFQMFPPCIDHDIFEGIVPKIIIFALKYFKTSKQMGFLQLKNKINKFSFSGKDKKNFPSVSFDRIEQLRFTSAEGYSFIRFLPYFMQSISCDDKVYQIVNHLNKIVLILMSDSIDQEMIVMLRNVISNFLKFCSDFSDLPMTVKFHHLIHYPSNILRYGPPKVFRTINFESLHSHLKRLMRSSKNWTDVCFTIGSKYARRNSALKGQQKPVEIGLKDDNSLLGLKMNNQSYYPKKNGMFIFKDTGNFFIQIENIEKQNNNYLIDGTIHDYYLTEFNSCVILATKNKFSYMIGTSDSSDISYEIYYANEEKFIIPYFYLE